MKKSVVVLTSMLAISISTHAKANEQLIGTWRLVSLTQTIVATNEKVDIFGKSPQGFINYGRDNRMMVLIVKDERPKPGSLEKMTDPERAELFKTMIAYGGTYTIEGKTITHHIDISSNEVWTGTNQVRNIKFDGRKVILTTNPQPRPQDGKVAISTLTWEKLE
ncbi:lipocalin-like domain-containing protein [Noviherbaspirillum pedocola]|uniref:Lipocalin-like domain-containing protein n=1 Tax=Noviherbaspirillum pedocola TaxID=2801341 RepID=A0A934W9P8_9BURK|nr:lipocalin-like domain-containing protein [Noviherbaspirillum pedocola]MBK4737394.1 lipocalin-like domain-containing protein [Noviherbaspirillum pedocola]